MELDSVADTQSFSVTIVGFDGALASSITGAIDMFALAGVAMERIYQKPINRLFSVQLAALDVGPTTHWGYADAFSTLFPKVNLQAQQLITQDQQLFCAGGGMAWYDLVLRLIERYAGHRTAADTAKSHVIDFARGQQSLYAPLNRRKFHHDKEILLLQDWLENNYAVTNSIADMAEVCSLTPRTLNRRFKRATGQTPQTYLQALRIEQAKKLLENTELPISEIVNKVGYDDVSSFARLFKKLTSLSPGYYRSSFRN
jgi:transcriptional regulator GlxA family with amidase domain